MQCRIPQYLSLELLVAYGSRGRRKMNTGINPCEALPWGRGGVRPLEELLPDGGDHLNPTCPNLILYYSHVPTPPWAWVG